MDILEKILTAKEEYLKRLKKLKDELKALRETKAFYEETGKNSNSNYEIITDLEKKIEEHEISIQRCSEKIKEISKKATTIKSSNTKISKKEKIISDIIEEISTKLNSDNENQNREGRDSSLVLKLENLIDILKQYNKQGIINIPPIDTIETELSKLDNESLKRLFEQMQAAMRILKGAIKAKGNAIEKFNKLTEPKKASVKKVAKTKASKAKSDGETYKKGAKRKRNFAESRSKHKSSKQQIIEETFTDIISDENENGKSKNEAGISNASEAQAVEEEKNEEIQIDETIRKIIEEKVDINTLKDKSLDEIIKIAEEIKFFLCNNGYMLHIADEAFRYIITISSKSDEYKKREQETFDVWSNVPDYEGNINQGDGNEQVADYLPQTEKTIAYDETVKDETVKDEEVRKETVEEETSEEKKGAEEISKEKIDEEDIYRGKRTKSGEEVGETGGAVATNIQQKLRDVDEPFVEREEPKKQMEDIYSSDIAEEITENRRIQREKGKKQKDEKNQFQYINTIRILESQKKVEVDGRIIEMNRHLDLETENRVDNICERLMKKSKKLSNLQKSELKRLKKCLDPTIINAIRDTYLSKSNLDRWDKAIKENDNIKDFMKDKKNNNIFYMEIKSIQEIALNAQRANEEKRKAEEMYIKILSDYIKSVFYLDWNFNPFGDITYDCYGNISVSEYNKIAPYLKTIENIGGQVIGKRSFFGLLQEKKGKKARNDGRLSQKQDTEDMEEISKSTVPSKSKEGDTSFVERVTTRKRC